MRSFILFLLLSLGTSAFAQRPFIEDFTLRGDTYLTEEDCFRLTEAVDYRSGSIWYKRPASLMQPFSVELQIMAGCEDELGADGMVFVFSAQPNVMGYVGEGIGFSGLRPSVGIEIDTWRNYHLDDPAEDHLAIMFNGRMGHFQNQAVPQAIPNIEDCLRHRFVVIWQPETQRLSVEIDRKEVIAVQTDLRAVFQSDEVFWGVTAATGRYNNIHEVCFDRIGQILPEQNLPYPMRIPRSYLATTPTQTTP